MVDTSDRPETDACRQAGGRHLLHGDVTNVVIGAFFNVYNELGNGFLEAVYANALTVVLERAGVSVERQVPFHIQFHGKTIGSYRADLIVAGSVIVEVKAGYTVDPRHCAQLLNYLRATGLEVGLLLNFGPKAEFRRVIATARHQNRAGTAAATTPAANSAAGAAPSSPASATN